jgi:hypothetical protein
VAQIQSSIVKKHYHYFKKSSAPEIQLSEVQIKSSSAQTKSAIAQ